MNFKTAVIILFGLTIYFVSMVSTRNVGATNATRNVTDDHPLPVEQSEVTTEMSKTTNTTLRPCRNDKCGFTVFDRDTKYTTLSIKNVCVCPSGWSCVRNIYVLGYDSFNFFCREVVTEDDILLPANAQ